MKRKSTSRAMRGNQNAAKPPEERRVTLSLRVRPETRRRLDALAATHGSLSAAVDHLADPTTKQTTTAPSPEVAGPDRSNRSGTACK